MPRKKKIIIICLSSITALLIFTIAILPLIVRSQAVSAIEQETGRKARIDKVSINPFTLSITVSGFAIQARDGSQFISIGKLRTSLGMASIYRRAMILSEITIDSPAISFARLAANSYSFNDIIDRLKAKPKTKSKSDLQFSINNISITNGSLDFDDRAVPGGRKHTVRNLKVAVPFISNIPFLVEKYTDPHISALVNGAPFSFNGKVKPLSKSMETSVHIDLKQLSLPEYVAYSPVKPPADLVSGKLSIESEVTYRVSSDKKPELGVKGQITLDTIVVNLPGGKPLLKLPSFQVKASDLEFFARKFLFDAVTVEGLELFASRNAKGEWMYSQLLPTTPAANASAPATDIKAESIKPAPQPLVQVAAFDFNNGIIHLSDAQPAGGFKSEITEIDAAVRNFSTAADITAEYEFSLLMDKEATFSTDGKFSISPLTATASSELSGMKIQRVWPYLSQFLTAPVKGTVDLSSEIAFSKELGLTVEQGNVRLTGFSARYGDKEGFDLARFEINGAGFSQKENKADISEVRLSKADLSLSREIDGSISALSLLKAPPAKSAASANQTSSPAAAAQVSKPSAVSEQKQPSAKEFSFRLKKFQVDKFNAAFTDKSFEDKPRFTLNNTSLTLTNVNGPKFTPAGLKFTSTLNKATPIKVIGDITPLPFRYKGSVNIGRLPLRDFETYFPSNINVFILGGFADTDMNVDISLKDGKPVGSFRGSAGIRAFHAIDTVAEEDLLKWESLQLDDIQGNLDPFSLALRQIALNGVYSRIIIRKDGSLNLQNLVEKPLNQGQGLGGKGQEEKTSAGATPTAPVSSPQQAAAAQPSNVKIDAITIQDGTLSFTDNHLPQRFTTTFFNLGGRVSGLSSEDAKLADVDLRGNLENHSPLEITGQINPLRGDLFVDLKISFRDIELSPTTPYTGRFLGYTVEKGKLFLDLKYRIDKKKLDSENKVFIDQFTFGEKVESDKATNLPVKLGLALLKDRKGEIHLDLPVTGRTDDPKFSIWGVVWQVVRNVLVKAVTSPFSLLSSMFGGGQDFSTVQFSIGTSLLSPQDQQKLSALSKALLDRPALKVELKGYVDRDRDTEGYRSDLLNRKLRNEKFLAMSKEGTLKEGEKIDTIQVLPEEYARYLTAVYKKEKFPKPRNVLGFVKEIPTEEMKKLIVANTVIGEPELQTLARERVLAVKNYLVLKCGVPPERVFEKNDNIFKAPEKETVSRSRVELNAFAQ
jgi:hypothetical protein